MNVLIVDDEPLAREGLKLLLAEEPRSARSPRPAMVPRPSP